jgi:hypothetical protein
MITEIRLSQLKDTYTGNEDILIPLVNILKKSHDFKHYLDVSLNLQEVILVHKTKEWITELQMYEPLPSFSYLVRALKLIYPEPWQQSQARVMIIVILISRKNINEAMEAALLESSKLKVLISKGDEFINAYADNIINQKKLSSKLSSFAELINNAEVDNGAE